MTNRVTAKGGPLDGKTYDIPDTAKTLDHHAATGGQYNIKGKTATWTDDKPQAD